MAAATSIKQQFRSLPKWLRIVSITLLLILALLCILWTAAAWYIKSHKQELLADITQKLSEQVDGTLTIGDLEPAFFKNFPSVSFRLKDIHLSDSLVHEHGHELLNIKDLYLKLNTFSLISRHPQIEKITIANGSIYLYVAPNGYSNTYLLKGKKKRDAKSEKKKAVELERVELEHIHFVFDHKERNKKFEVKVKNIDADIAIKGDRWNINADTDAWIGQLGFNLEKGGFLVNKNLDADLKLVFIRSTGELQIPNQEIEVGGQDIKFGGSFKFGAKPVTYSLVIDAAKINLDQAASFLSRNIARHFDNLELKYPLAVHATINGKMEYPDTPIINVRFNVRNNELNTSAGLLTQASFEGSFDNEGINGFGHSDENSVIRFVNCKAVFEGIPVNADSIRVVNLIDPVMTARIFSKFRVEKLDALAGSAYKFSNGEADFDLLYHGPLRAQNTTPRSLKGTLHIINAGLKYVPRNLQFNKCNATLVFDGEDLYMKDILLSSRRSVLHLDGVAKSFLSAYFSDPNKVSIKWNVRSNLLDLNEFTAFLTPRKSGTTSVATRNKKIRQVNAQLDELLERGSMNLNMAIKKIVFRKFTAENIQANIDLLESGIALKNVHVNHAGGTIALNGAMQQSQSNNPFHVKADIKNVQVDKLFYAFENFGQQTLDAKNLQGKFSATVDVKGGMTEAAQIIPQSFRGYVDFQLNDGALVKFKPLEAVSKFVFKKRNLDNVTFKQLSNRLDIDAGKIIINPMTIESSALVIHAKGVYALDKGTDISMEIPLRNPQKDRDRIAQGKEPRKRKGVVIYLRAQDDETGKVRIAWDPLRKGDREVDEQLFQDSEPVE